MVHLFPRLGLRLATLGLKMADSHCPICYSALEVRDVAPCYDCGHGPEELEHFAEKKHTYAEMCVLGIDIILCYFCQVDFSSYNPTYFGRARRIHLGGELTFVRDVLNPSPGKDKYCPSCGRRLAFLRFLAAARTLDEPGITTEISKSDD